MDNPLKALQSLGQSIWYDNLRRAMLTSGELQRLVDQGVTGVTSNPTIFEKAIAGSMDYDAALDSFVQQGYSPETIYEALVLEDIRGAADVLRPVFDRTGGSDGFVSLEVRPTLAYDTHGTINEARRLFTALDRPNVMIKVPATPEGIPAIKALIADGININITLIFSLSQYEAVADAYLSGLEKRLASGQDIRDIASVASFFVSRVDTAVNRELERIGVSDLQGKIAIANAKIAYARFREIFTSTRWEKLATLGGRVQRPLWASTGTKNPYYPDTLYVESLIGPETVNTVPPATLDAFRDHGRVSRTLEEGLATAKDQMTRLAKLGIDLETITAEIQTEGVASFAKSFESLIGSIAAKREQLRLNWSPISAELGGYQASVDSALAEMEQERVMARLWAHDYTLWRPEPTEITNRLGWLNTVEVMQKALPKLSTFVDAVRSDGYTHALLLGMGGSSLAPEVFHKTFGVKAGYLDLAVLDSTDPGAVLAFAEGLDLTKTLFIVSTKSGGTVETLSFFKYFYNRVADSLGKDRAGEHFVAITDPGSQLVDTADRYKFRATFLNDTNIGGRYSALSYFGLVPAALVGVDLETLLDRAHTAACNCDSYNYPIGGDNLGARLGAVLGELAIAGRDKLTLIASPIIASIADWVEQLIAESTGKEGKGILPVVGEPLERLTEYGADRLFVHLRLEGDDSQDTGLQSVEDEGHPVVRLRLKDLYDLGGQFFLWEMATAVAGYRLGINPFDQPDVEAAKVLARKMVAAYQATGKLPEPNPTLVADGIAVYADDTTMRETLESGDSPGEMLRAFVDQAQPGDYIAIQAYVQPTVETNAALHGLRTQLRVHTKLATTVGYGPRYLHSTGQLHKGDAGRGLFIQITADSQQDAPIPDEAGLPESTITFGVLKMAQALGDYQALLDANRRVIRFHLGMNVPTGLKILSGRL